MVSVFPKAARFVAKFGFTLAELIVVITILAILATVGFLALSGYTQDANVSAMKTNARSVYTAISAESAVTGNSPRYYVVHDSAAALSSAIVVIDGKNNVLTGWAWNAVGTNYSAGNPDYVKLKLNPEKFRISRSRLFDAAFAAYAPGAVSIGAADLQSGTSSRTFSAVQVSATSPSTWAVAVVGGFPPNSSSTVTGLIKSPSSTGALVDETSVSVASLSVSLGYPGCADADITLGNGQVWAACNVGATRAFDPASDTVATCTNSTVDCNASNRSYLWGYYQWGRNDNLAPANGSTTTLATAGTLSDGVGHAKYILRSGITYDWIATANPDLWGWSGMSDTAWTFASATSTRQGYMKWPCSSGYHVPTTMEWKSAVSSIAWTALGSNFTDMTKFDLVVTKLKLPMAWIKNRIASNLWYTNAAAYTTYWSSVSYGIGSDYVYSLALTPSNGNVLLATAVTKDAANPVRCMKDY